MNKKKLMEERDVHCTVVDVMYNLNLVVRVG